MHCRKIEDGSPISFGVEGSFELEIDDLVVSGIVEPNEAPPITIDDLYIMFQRRFHAFPRRRLTKRAER